MSRVVKVFGLKLWPQAGCENCDRTWGPSDIARDLAKDHVRKTGHTVQVETIQKDVYRMEES